MHLSDEVFGMPYSWSHLAKWPQGGEIRGFAQELVKPKRQSLNYPAKAISFLFPGHLSDPATTKLRRRRTAYPVRIEEMETE